MNMNARIMLQALAQSGNQATAESARALLTGAKMPWAGEDSDTQHLALAGRLGGLIQAVMTGDLRDSWRAADDLNQMALEDTISKAFR